MSMYAPNPDCAACEAIGALCVNCAFDWRLKHTSEELVILRRVAKMVESALPRELLPGLSAQVAKWRAHQKKKPPLKKVPSASRRRRRLEGSS